MDADMETERDLNRREERKQSFEGFAMRANYPCLSIRVFCVFCVFCGLNSDSVDENDGI